jgi:hypothetical protein
VLREIREDMAEIVEESKVRRKELATVSEKKGLQGRAYILKSSEVRKEKCKREDVERRQEPTQK